MRLFCGCAACESSRVFLKVFIFSRRFFPAVGCLTWRGFNAFSVEFIFVLHPALPFLRHGNAGLID
jgi:hypothetical protein